MDSSTKQANLPEPDVERSALPSSPLPTPQSAETPPKSAQPATNSFQPTALTFADLEDAEDHHVRAGANIDGYVVLKTIASTKMSVVFQARQPGSGQIVALKLIQHGAFADRESIERFQQEIKTLGLMQPHNNIMPIYHVGRHGNELYYVMPFLAGGSLAQQMRRFQADQRQSVALVEKIARAVQQLHTQKPKILHRDIKPANILLTTDDEPLLADFGLIKLLDDSQVLTQTHKTIGTPAYMAPEQTGLVPTAVSERTDVWALGVVLYELLTGARPFTKEENEDAAKLFWRIVHEQPPPPRSVKPNLDAGLAAVMMKCLKKLPQDRYGTAEELADELARWLRGDRPHARPESKMRRWWRSWKRWRMSAAAAMFVFFFGAVAAVYWRPPDPERALTDLQRRYVADQRVVLAEAKQPLAWDEWLFKKSGALARSADGYHQISTDDLAVLALVKDLPADTFRLRAKLRHDVAATLESEIGIFVACRPIAAGKKPAYLMYLCTFNDNHDAKEMEKLGFLPPNTIRGNNFYLNFKVAALVGDEFEQFEPRWVQPANFKPAGHVGGRWRDVAIEVHADHLIACLDESRTGSMSLEEAEKRLSTGLPEFFIRNNMPVPKVRKMFDREGSAGIFVTRGIASFKDVVIESISSR